MATICHSILYTWHRLFLLPSHFALPCMVQDLWAKWGLDQNSYMKRFSFDEFFSKEQKDVFIRDLFASEAVRIRLSPLPAFPLSSPSPRHLTWFLPLSIHPSSLSPSLPLGNDPPHDLSVAGPEFTGGCKRTRHMVSNRPSGISHSHGAQGHGHKP
jgi:hypothetical protein